MVVGKRWIPLDAKRVYKFFRDNNLVESMFTCPIKKNIRISLKNSECYGAYLNDILSGCCFITKKDENGEGNGNKLWINVAFLPTVRGSGAYYLAKLFLCTYGKKYDKLLGRIKRANKASLYFSQHMGFSIIRKTDDSYIVRS